MQGLHASCSAKENMLLQPPQTTASTSPFCVGHDSFRPLGPLLYCISSIETWPSQIRKPRLNGGGPGRGRQVGGCPPRWAQCWTKKRHLFAEKAPEAPSTWPNEEKQTLYAVTLLFCSCQRSAFQLRTPQHVQETPHILSVVTDSDDTAGDKGVREAVS